MRGETVTNVEKLCDITKKQVHNGREDIVLSSADDSSKKMTFPCIRGRHAIIGDNNTAGDSGYGGRAIDGRNVRASERRITLWSPPERNGRGRRRRREKRKRIDDTVDVSERPYAGDDSYGDDGKRRREGKPPRETERYTRREDKTANQNGTPDEKRNFSLTFGQLTGV